MNDLSQNSLRSLPSVNAVLDHAAVRPLVAEHGRDAVLTWIRNELNEVRRRLSGTAAHEARAVWLDEIADRLASRAQAADEVRFAPVINATGIILHTGLGRAPLSRPARAALDEMSGAGNLEIDLATTDRRYRGHQLQPSFQTLTACEDSLVVNNNAAATLLTLQALCAGREVIISRGQLIEIGGSFRLPEIFELSGARLREVGTTNRTRLSDYQRAIGPDTAALMLVHPSNYRIVGFSESPGISELARMAQAHQLIAIDDIGSGSLTDMTRFGLPPEPTFQNSLAAGADVVLGSGDKLLGGPQAGIILGRSAYLQRLRQHPLARAVRVDKLTLAALGATLDSYLRGAAVAEVPALALLASPLSILRERAAAILAELGDLPALTVCIGEDSAPVGGGTLPGGEIPTVVLVLRHATLSADEVARRLRLGRIRVVGRIRRDAVVCDLRSVLPEEDTRLALALRMLAGLPSAAALNEGDLDDFGGEP